MDHTSAYALWLTCGLVGFFAIILVQWIVEPKDEIIKGPEIVLEETQSSYV
jgi:hypothetical protein